MSILHIVSYSRERKTVALRQRRYLSGAAEGPGWTVHTQKAYINQLLLCVQVHSSS